MSQRKAREARGEKGRLIKEIMAEYQPKTLMELQDVLKEIFAPMMEDMLQGELDAHLGYSKHDQGTKETTDRRNGTYDKTVRSKMGEIDLRIPRDRDGDYEPELIPKGQRDVSGIEEKVLSMYAKGVSDRDISATIDDIYGFTLSAETISKIVDKVSPRLHEWQNRTLED